MKQANDLIELEELKLGNLLLHKGQLVYVSALSYDIDDEYEELIGITPFGKTSDEVYKWNQEFGKDLQRIPITKEIMAPLGYTNKGSDFIYHSVRWSCREYWVFLSSRGLEYKTGSKRFRTMYFLHELQNFHYSLTGKDLEILAEHVGEIKKATEQRPPSDV